MKKLCYSCGLLAVDVVFKKCDDSCPKFCDSARHPIYMCQFHFDLHELECYKVLMAE